MPAPTREQFEVAAKRVIAAAPPGLSQDQFFALVDKEVAKLPPDNATAIGDATRGATPKPLGSGQGEPSFGGFFRNLAKDTFNTAQSVVDSGNRLVHDPVSTIAALPGGIWNRIKEVGSDVHPIDAIGQLKEGRPGAALGNLLPVGQAYNKPAQLTADVYAGGQLAKLGKALAMKAVRPPVIEGEVVDPTMKVPGAQEGEIVETAPLPQHGGRLPRGTYEAGPSSAAEPPPPAPPSPVFDEKGRMVAPPQPSIPERPAGPWDANADAVVGGELTKQMAAPDAAVTPGGFGPEGWGDQPADWHAYPDDAARKAAPPAERNAIRATHQYQGEMDARYHNLTHPDFDLGSFSPEGLLAKLMWELVKERFKQSMAAPRSPDMVGRGAGLAIEAAKQAPRAGAITNLTRPPQSQQQK